MEKLTHFILLISALAMSYAYCSEPPLALDNSFLTRLSSLASDSEKRHLIRDLANRTPLESETGSATLPIQTAAPAAFSAGTGPSRDRLAEADDKSQQQTTNQFNFYSRYRIVGLATLGGIAVLVVSKLVQRIFYDNNKPLKAIKEHLEILNKHHQHIPIKLQNLAKGRNAGFTQTMHESETEADLISFFKLCDIPSLISKLDILAVKASPQMKKEWEKVYASHGIMEALQTFNHRFNQTELPQSKRELIQINYLLKRLRKRVESIEMACGGATPPK